MSTTPMPRIPANSLVMVAEVSKTLTRSPLADIERALSAS